LLVTFRQWENAIDEVIDATVLVLSEELRVIVREKRKRGRKCRNWIARRESLGASNCSMNYLVKIRKNIENT
jgi:hypothetical protein